MFLPGKLGKGNQPSAGLGPVQLLLEEARQELSNCFCAAVPRNDFSPGIVAEAAYDTAGSAKLIAEGGATRKGCNDPKPDAAIG